MDGLNEKKNLLEQCLIEAVIPKDEDDYGCDAILEIRAGTGGDEVSFSLFLFFPLFSGRFFFNLAKQIELYVLMRDVCAYTRYLKIINCAF
mmetsp:Transcript_58282/g.86653  ORF Transcript_58282/g.86653 Transcript_58282/m.86653 type:complete len:91 (+) Transcript_58282:41-313(+)